MTVKQLIEILIKANPETEVFVDTEGHPLPLREVEVGDNQTIENTTAVNLIG